MRHPDRAQGTINEFLWAHHEKLVIIGKSQNCFEKIPFTFETPCMFFRSVSSFCGWNRSLLRKVGQFSPFFDRFTRYSGYFSRDLQTPFDCLNSCHKFKTGCQWNTWVYFQFSILFFRENEFSMNISAGRHIMYGLKIAHDVSIAPIRALGDTV